MSETPFVEANALLALIRGDTEEAQAIIDEMSQYERQLLAKAARELATRADDSGRCPGCQVFIESMEPSVSVSYLGGGYQRWHTGCREDA